LTGAAMVLSGDYIIREVGGTATAEVLRYLNALAPDRFPMLADHHLAQGYWWLARTWDRSIVGFAGMVPMAPFDVLGVGYLKRAYITQNHRGQGLQLKMLRLREERARALKWTMLVSECGADNTPSQNNFIKAGFVRTTPEQCWGEPGSIYFVKRLTAEA